MVNNEGKVALYLMTFKGLSTLKAIVESNLTDLVAYVVIGTDKNTVNDYSAEMRKLCDENGIKYFSRKDQVPQNAAYIITVSWRWLIKNTASKLIIFHESLLPRYRGFAPLVNQLINKEPFIGVSAIFGEEEYDTGDVIAQEKMAVEYPITIHEAIVELSSLYEKLIRTILNEIKEYGTIRNAYPQNEDDITFSLWRDEDDYAINWTKSADYISRFIDSVGYPYKGASALMDDQIIRITSSKVFPDVKIENRDCGKIIFFKNERPVVVCGEGLLLLEEASYNGTGNSIFPLSKFRIRFK